MKVLITGVCGTGKSTISRALKERGIRVFDFPDIPGLSTWRNKKTKEEVKYSLSNQTEWFDLNERVCDVKKLKEVLDQYDDIVITGLASGNHAEYFPLFDKVFLLQCSPETFVYRMETRTSSFGKTQAEQDNVTELQKTFDPCLLSQGAIPINTEEPLDTVVDKIAALIS